MENLVVPSLGGPTIVSTRAGSLGVSTTRTIAGCLLAGCLRLTLKVRLNRSQRHRPKGRSGWFIGVHWWPVAGGGGLFLRWIGGHPHVGGSAYSGTRKYRSICGSLPA